MDHGRLAISTISSLRAGLGSEVVGLAQWAACPSCRKPGVNARSMESMTASQAPYIVIVFQRVNANGARVTRRPQAFWRQSSINMFVFVILVMGDLAKVLVGDSGVGVGVAVAVRIR